MKRWKWLVACVTASCVVVLSRSPSRERPILARPVPIAPERSRPNLAGAPLECWRIVAEKLRREPPFGTLPDLLHHIENGLVPRVSGASGRVAPPSLVSSLLDGDSSLWSRRYPSWLYRDAEGRPRISRLVDAGGAAHASQILATLAALDIPSSQIIRSRETTATVADLVEALQDDFHLKGEVEWKVMALIRYAPTIHR